MLATAKITSKGQLTLPRAARKALGNSTVDVEIIGETVVLRAIKSVGGALSKYAVSGVPFQDVRNKVWGEVANDKNQTPS